MTRVWTLLVGLVACGPGPEIFPSFDGGSGSFHDATLFGFDASEVIDAAPPPFDAGLDSGRFNGGGPFLCEKCMCDGTLDMCFHSGGGPPSPMPIDDGGISEASSDASICEVDGAANACRQIPIACLPKPTCACILAATSPACMCTVDPSGNGFTIDCVYE